MCMVVPGTGQRHRTRERAAGVRAMELLGLGGDHHPEPAVHPSPVSPQPSKNPVPGQAQGLHGLFQQASPAQRPEPPSSAILRAAPQQHAALPKVPTDR